MALDLFESNACSSAPSPNSIVRATKELRQWMRCALHTVTSRYSLYLTVIVTRHRNSIQSTVLAK
ncbi:hypothetical protein TcasGA2_TC008213 [Tribolium castaneum]|uniref:Uncharacterized protein n=1 Tax=Tribolium castaneum TaxID=7070 RepID=D2A0I6_TRICA|nr:hypothetical protein TcasGA2_TC008213 [Tribolium castaneum]